MIILDDNESKTVKKFIKYSDNFESLVIDFKDKDLSLELIIGDDLAIFEIRDKDSFLMHRHRISLSSVRGIQKLIELEKDND